MILYFLAFSFIVIFISIGFTLKGFNKNSHLMHMCLLGIFLFITEANFRYRDLDDTSIDFQILLRIAVWVGVTSFAFLYFRRTITFLFSVNVRYLTFYCLLCLATTVYSPIPFYTFVNSTIQICFLIFAATIAINLTLKQICLSIFYMSLGFHTISIVLIPIFPELTIMQFWGMDEIGGQRITGLSGSANSYGQMAGLAVIVTQYLRKNLAIKKSIYVMSIIFFSACLLASWSRTSIFITIIGFLLIEKELFNRYKYTMLAAFSFSTVSYFAIFDIENLLMSFSRNGSINEIFTFTGRTGIWEAVWNESLNNPMFGHGYASTKLLLPTIFETDWGWSTVTAHNMFLQSFFTTGFFGIALLSITLLIFFKACHKLKNGLLNYFLFLTIVNGLLESGAVGPIPNKLTFMFFLFFMKSIDIHLRSIRESER